jgi:hypothetical protein
MISEKFSLKKTFSESYNPMCIGNPGPAKLYGTRKVVQLTGDIDRETGNKTINQTVKRFNIYGTDLGVSFIYRGKLCFLFGDTTRRGPSEGLPKSGLPGTHYNEIETDYDAIAFTTSIHAYDGVILQFNSSPPIVEDISQLTAETPIEGFSIGDEMYVFFATDMDRRKRILPTRTVLTKSTDGGYRFGNSLYTLSTDKFIHVSVQIIDNDKIDGLPRTTGKSLLLWGTGKYRQSDIYLACIPLDEVSNRSSISFFTGFESYSNRPLWQSDESLAKPLFSARCIGELSIRWNYYLEKWVMLYNCDLCNTNGIIIRLADLPWGPWSSPKIIFDPVDGHRRFIHIQGEDNLVDDDRDDKSNPYDLGYPYGPYQMTPYTTGVKGRYAKIYFTLSVWNPYQVLQMSAIILSEKENAEPLPYAKDVHDRNDRKYAYISVLLAHLANSRKLEFKYTFGNSSFIADHIEWSQFHSHRELRDVLKNKVSQFIKSIPVDTDVAEAYAAINSAIVRLAYDYTLFNNVVNADIYRKWALSCIHSGQRELIIDEIHKNIDSYQFLPDHDYLFYAYGPEDGNEFKYARVKSLLQTKILEVKSMGVIDQKLITTNEEEGGRRIKYKQEYGEIKSDLIPLKEKTTGNTNRDSNDIKKDLDDQERQVPDSFIAWARFRHVNELRSDLIDGFNKIVNTSAPSDYIAKAFAEIVNVVLDLSNKRIDDKTNTDLYRWALSVISSQQDNACVAREMSKYLRNDGFLVTQPSNNVLL